MFLGFLTMKFLRMITKHFLFFVTHIFFVLQKKFYLIINKGKLDHDVDNDKLIELVKELQKNGFVVIKDFFDKDKVESMCKYFYEELETKEKDFFAYLDRNKVALDKLKEQNINYKKKVNYAIYGSEKEEDSSYFFNIIAKFKIFDTYNTKFLQSLLTMYLNYFPKLTSGNLRISFSNSEPASDTQLFHRDASGYKFLKCFVYLHDVDKEHGPLTYIKSSHKDLLKFKDDLKLRYDDNEIIERYSEKSVTYLTAKKTDLIIADTSGFHKGSKNIKERVMLTLHFHAHSEVFRKKKFYLETNTYQKMLKVWGKRYLKYLNQLS